MPPSSGSAAPSSFGPTCERGHRKRAGLRRFPAAPRARPRTLTSGAALGSRCRRRRRRWRGGGREIRPAGSTPAPGAPAPRRTPRSGGSPGAQRAARPETHTALSAAGGPGRGAPSGPAPPAPYRAAAQLVGGPARGLPAVPARLRHGGIAESQQHRRPSRRHGSAAPRPTAAAGGHAPRPESAFRLRGARSRAGRQGARTPSRGGRRLAARARGQRGSRRVRRRTCGCAQKTARPSGCDFRRLRATRLPAPA